MKARLGPVGLETLDTLIMAGIAATRAEAIRWALDRIRERPAYEQPVNACAIPADSKTSSNTVARDSPVHVPVSRWLRLAPELQNRIICVQKTP